MDAAWRKKQYEDGAWSYRHANEDPNSPRTLSMTAAGVATLFITQEHLALLQGVDCNPTAPDENLMRGLQWINQNFQTFEKNRTYYTLYGIERIGVASGLKYFGNLNWYEVGSEFLVRRQQGNGSWGDLPDTCFGLMFLSRGRAPVMMNKLAWTNDEAGDKPKPPTWNLRPREVANVTRWVGRQIERDLNWQITNFNAPVEELHDAPILWISGKGLAKFTPEQEGKLKRYVEEGGLIVAHADCSDFAFGESMRKLGTRLFPMYEFRELPDDHPIFTRQQFQRKQGERKPRIQALSNGVRELMILFNSEDPGRGWQTQSFSGAQRLPLAQAMANIFLYAVDKQNLRYKGQTFLAKPVEGKQAKRTIKVARLQYAGNWDPEPAGWRRMAVLLQNQHEVGLEVTPVELGKGKLAGFPVAHLTGTATFRPTDAQKAELADFVKKGGTLIVDPAGGNGDFAIAADAMLSSLLGAESKFKPVPADHAVFAKPSPLGDVQYRAFARRVVGNIRTPRLQMIESGGRPAIFFGTEDLSAGLVGQPVDGVYGYSPESATQIMMRLLLSAK